MRTDHVIAQVCEYYQATPRLVRGPSQTPQLCRPRNICMYILSEMGLSTSVIGRMFSFRHHTTVMHSIRQARKLIASDIGARGLVDAVLTGSRMPEPPADDPEFDKPIVFTLRHAAMLEEIYRRVTA